MQSQGRDFARNESGRVRVEKLQDTSWAQSSEFARHESGAQVVWGLQGCKELFRPSEGRKIARFDWGRKAECEFDPAIWTRFRTRQDLLICWRIQSVIWKVSISLHGHGVTMCRTRLCFDCADISSRALISTILGATHIKTTTSNSLHQSYSAGSIQSVLQVLAWILIIHVCSVIEMAYDREEGFSAKNADDQLIIRLTTAAMKDTIPLVQVPNFEFLLRSDSLVRSKKPRSWWGNLRWIY